MLMTRSMLRDLQRALANHRVEENGSRLFVPSAKLDFGGAIAHTLNGEDLRIDDNMVVKEGRIYAIVVALANGSVIPSWYVAPFKNAAVVQDSWTAANFAGNAGEFTNYTESTRQQLVFPDPASISESNLSNATAAYTTIGAGADRTINGGGVISSPTRSGVDGKLWAAVKFATARSGLQENDKLGWTYLLTASNAA